MSTSVMMTKQDILDRLGEKLMIARQYDRKMLVEHAEKCRLAAIARREWAKGLIKLPLKELGELDIGYRRVWSKTNERNEDRGNYPAMPGAAECPMSKAREYERELERQKLDMRKHRTFLTDDYTYKLIEWTPEPINGTVCAD